LPTTPGRSGIVSQPSARASKSLKVVTRVAPLLAQLGELGLYGWRSVGSRIPSKSRSTTK
jgi:hypothetical protein